jgi:hypothetical protein
MRRDMADLKAGTITLLTTKNGRPRTLHFGGDVAKIFERRRSPG